MKYKEYVACCFYRPSQPFYRACTAWRSRRDGSCKNTGRCRELLVPGAEVILERSGNPSRKTKYDIICVNKAGRLINMDSQIPNRAAEEWIRNGSFFPEEGKFSGKNLRKFRFDLYVESGKRRAFIEVKGVTLEQDNVAFAFRMPQRFAASSIWKS